MTLLDRLNAFAYLGNDLRQLSKDDRLSLARSAQEENAWFTADSVSLALEGVDILLDEERLRAWALSYSSKHQVTKTIGVAMAGNIPLVGFHDFLTVLISGHRLKYKPSSKDSVLLNFVQERLLESEPRFKDLIVATDNLKDVDAIIATGSDNTSRYFEYYFRNIPNIIRKNRVSCAVIRGGETPFEIEQLGQDIFSYYGLGCRSVSKVYIPEGYDLNRLLAGLKPFELVMRNPKYANNYHYQKSLALIEKEEIHDAGFVLLRESSSLISPIATLHFEKYQHAGSLNSRIAENVHKIQVTVSSEGWFEGSVAFGSAQKPLISDYTDRVDTLQFLIGLGQ